MTIVDLLQDVAVVDNHCHAVHQDQRLDLTAWRSCFSESPDERMRTQEVVQTAFYRRLIRSLAAAKGIPADEAAVLQDRNRFDAAALVGDLFRGANIGGVVIDTGFPAPDSIFPREAFVASSGSRYRALLRLELLFQDLVAEHDTLDDVRHRLAGHLRDVRAQGFAGFKSIVGYRTGLDIQRWTDQQAQASFAEARAEFQAAGTVRLGHKALLDTLLHEAFEAASDQQLPVQFHVGYGDPDVDLRRAGPLELRGVLEDSRYADLPVVLLHGCWPFFREGAYLAAVYPHVYLDLSYAIPFLSTAELTSMTRAAFGAAPFGKLMYSSDGVRVPELHWLGAVTGRRVIGRVLQELVDDADIGSDEALAAGRLVLAENACRLYGFDGSGGTG